ncbi:hypothetical protein B0F90DRAFT_1754522 [Multifurca ochricompacta]|uniref:Uncharacterized protein n=1 Tax=Multifurca ochricompacta TaxID=376703 RepID=A0AAD4QKN6_9AGAM|nr:hypothetical protein B0F90DRAFT_1754522 [Multifurca ochricompacta]
MPLLSASLDQWLPTICSLLLPFIVRFLFKLRSKKKQSSPPAPAPLRTPISILLALYTLYHLFNILFARPPNLFTSLQLPLNAPQSVIRAAFLRNDSDNTALPPAFEKLLARLASVDARTMLVRFGQRAVQTCTHCTSETDYALHVLAPTLLSYTLAATMLGLVTIHGTARESRRGLSIMLLIFSALAEAYWAYTVPIMIPSRQKHHQFNGNEIIMWHDVLWSLRQALFLALPLTIHLLPAPPYTPPLRTTLAAFSRTSDSIVARTHLLRLSSTGIQRAPELRTRAAEFWARDRKLGDAIRLDSDVRAVAEREGLGITPGGGGVGGGAAKTQSGSQDHVESTQDRTSEVEGALHKAARGAVVSLKEAGLKPPPPPPDAGTVSK